MNVQCLPSVSGVANFIVYGIHCRCCSSWLTLLKKSYLNDRRSRTFYCDMRRLVGLDDPISSDSIISFQNNLDNYVVYHMHVIMNLSINVMSGHLTYHLRAWNVDNIFAVNVHPQYHKKRRNTIWQAKKLLNFWEASPLRSPDQGRSPWTPLEAQPPDPHIGSRSP